MGKRVLILSASAGTGHLRAADALAKVFRVVPGVDEVLNDDALAYSNTVFKDIYSRLYAKMIRLAPEFLGWWYESSDEPWKAAETRLLFDRLNTTPLVRFIKSYRPDIIVCTHFMPAGVIGHLIGRRRLAAHLSIVVTDFDVHAMWLTRAFHRYFVATEENRAHLVALGLPERRISVSGIPVDPAFAAPADRRAVREKHGLAADRPVLLVSAGALGVSPAESVVKRLMELRHDVQVVVVCGRNEELRADISALTSHRASRFRVIGFTNEMHHLMRVADLLIGKPGGLTTSESMVCGLPMVIVEPIPGQEDRNSDYLLENGAAVKCNESTILTHKIDRLLDDHTRLRQMRTNALRLGRPDAAAVIVATLLRDEGLPPMKITRALRRRMFEEARHA